MNALFLQPTPKFKVNHLLRGGAIWNSLQELKEETTRELLDDGPLCQSQPDELYFGGVEDREIGLRHRSQLEHRLVEISDAQDRLLDGSYGSCIECREEINAKRLAADPAASLCLDCQKLVDGERSFPKM